MPYKIDGQLPCMWKRKEFRKDSRNSTNAWAVITNHIRLSMRLPVITSNKCSTNLICPETMPITLLLRSSGAYLVFTDFSWTLHIHSLSPLSHSNVKILNGLYILWSYTSCECYKETFIYMYSLIYFNRYINGFELVTLF